MAKTTANTQQSPMQKQFAATCEDKRKSMFLYVARELTGRAMQRKLSDKEKSLNWEKFNEYFNQYYADYTADEMLAEILSNVYWLASEQAVIDLYFRYLDDIQRNNNGNGKAQSEELDFAK
jgi:hypothetical protein